MKTISINDVEFNIPTNWNDLSKRQLLEVCRLLNDNTPINQINILWYLFSFKIYKLKDLRNWNMIRKLPAEWIHTLLTDKTFFGFIFNKAELSNYPFKKIRIGRRVFYGPPNKILNIKAVEVTFGYELFKLYDKTKKMEFLDRLIAILYRERNWFSFLKSFKYGYNGDIRTDLNSYKMESRLKYISKLDHSIKLAIFLNFATCWENFQKLKQYEYVFQKVENSPSKKEDPLIWQKIMMKMAESGVFGTLTQVEQMDREPFFLFMQKNIEEYLEIKDRSNKKR